MNSKYEYLKKYMGDPKHPKVAGFNEFFPIAGARIIDAEKRLGYKFPDQLRQFYLEIGVGFFYHNHNRSIVQKSWSNRLLGPEYIADIKLLGYDSGWVTSDVEFADEELPFFEVCDGNDFLHLKPHSNHPNRVYDITDEPIADSFEEFIWKLYYVSPIYYFDED